MEKVIQTINEEHKGERLDKVLSSVNNEWSRSQVQLWMQEGNVVVNGQKVKSSYKCSVGDVIEISIPDPEELDVVPETMDLEIFMRIVMY